MDERKEDLTVSGYFLTPPQDKRINQTRGVEEMNWGG